MLDRFRNAGNSIIVKVLIVLIILSFAVWGINNVFVDSSNGSKLAKVGDRVITAEMLDRQLGQDMERISAMFGFPMTKVQAIQFGFTNRVLENLIKANLLEMEAQAIGIRPSEKSIFNFVKMDQNFHDKDGNFDPELMRQLLKSNRINEDAFFGLVSKDIQKSMLAQAITVPVKTPDIISKTLYQYENEVRNIELYMVSEASLGKLNPPTDLELQAFYDKNKENYQLPETRSVSILEVSPDMIAQSVSATDDEVQDFYDENQKLFDIPETKQVDQIIAKTQESADVIKIGLQNGGDPEQISKENGASFVELKKISQNDMFFPQLGETTFALKKGEVSEPIQTPIGWIIVKVNQTYESSRPAYDTVKNKVKTLLLADKAKVKREELLEALEEDVQGDLPFTDVAKKYNVNLLTLSALTRETAAEEKALDKFVEKEQILQKAFTAIETEESEIIESRNGSLVALRVNNIVPVRVMTLDENREQVVKDWTNEIREEKAIALAKDLSLQANEDGADLNEIVATHKLINLYSGDVKRSGPTDPNSKIEISPYVLKDIFLDAKLGSSYLDSTGNAYLYRVNQVSLASMDGYEMYKKDIAEQIEQQIQNDFENQYVQALGEKFDVKLYPENMRKYIEAVFEQAQ